MFNGYTPSTKWEQLPHALREQVRERHDYEPWGFHAPDSCPCIMDDPGIESCKCGFDDLLGELEEHGYNDGDLERLFPDGKIY